jgi:hypothetical protein
MPLWFLSLGEMQAAWVGLSANLQRLRHEPTFGSSQLLAQSGLSEKEKPW